MNAPKPFRFSLDTPSPAISPDTGQIIVEAALTQNTCPWTHKGRSPRALSPAGFCGLDHVGLILHVLRCAGINAPDIFDYPARYDVDAGREWLTSWLTRFCNPIDLRGMAPGDILVFRMRETATINYSAILTRAAVKTDENGPSEAKAFRICHWHAGIGFRLNGYWMSRAVHAYRPVG